MKKLLSIIAVIACAACSQQVTKDTQELADPATPFSWKNATIYFLLTDRFHNADPSNDTAYRSKDGAPLRSYEGGDLKGLTEKINEGYFDTLGVNAIWLTPHIEQIKGSTDEGTGKTYAYHGYWASDWTAVDPNLGTMADMEAFVEAAHGRGIRVLLDVVINHTGPVTNIDRQWPDEWVRVEPPCAFQDAKTTIECTLVENLPDVKTENIATEVSLPQHLVAKWRAEGRYEQEVKELDAFFTKTQLPRTPRYYFIKWHLDWIRDLGVDGFRVDTAKHTEASVWDELKTLAAAEFENWKQKNPTKKLSDDPFYMTAEVYNYGIQGGQNFSMGPNENENFFAQGFDSLINFSLKGDGNKHYEEIFAQYSAILHGGDLNDYSVVNYMSSHDDHHPFDSRRTRPFETATKLLLAPGAVQIYYGDETARILVSEGAVGDANLRTPMNWDELANNAQRDGYRIQEVFDHWSKLGQFRQHHLAVGAGVHTKLQDTPYMFSRTLKNQEDSVVVALDLPSSKTTHTLKVHGVFGEGEQLKDYYSGQTITVKNDTIVINTPHPIVLLGKI